MRYTEDDFDRDHPQPFEEDDRVCKRDDRTAVGRVIGLMWNAPVRARCDEPGQQESWDIEVQWESGQRSWEDSDDLQEHDEEG